MTRVVPKAVFTGFSGATAASVVVPLLKSTICTVVRGSSRVVVVMFVRTGVVIQTNWWSFNAAAAATLRELPPFELTEGVAVPPSTASAEFR